MEEKTYFGSLYDQVAKYEIKAECLEPLHVGSSEGDRSEVLIHPVLGQPFLQATGIAGAFRDFFSYDEKLQNKMFGVQDGDDIAQSKVRFTDGFFEKGNVYTELRPRVRIDRKTGTCQSNSMNGGTDESGQKFEMEVVSSGSVFGFSIYIFEKKNKEEYRKNLEQALAALNNGIIQLGGQKSNGCGYVRLISVKKSVYDMKNEKDRNLWRNEDKVAEEIISNLSGNNDMRTHFVLDGRTEGSILVKALSVREYGDDAPDAENIRNHKKEYIIPASAVKGVVRNRIEKICKYKNMDDSIVEDIFGKTGYNETDGKTGCLRFYDCVIGDTAENDMAVTQKRIHIDKFTGGVMYQGLFSEKPAGGKVTIRVDVLPSGDDKAKALVLLALRDIGIGAVPLGGENSIGRGYIAGDKMHVSDGNNDRINIDFSDDSVSGDNGKIKEYLSALQ